MVSVPSLSLRYVGSTWVSTNKHLGDSGLVMNFIVPGVVLGMIVKGVVKLNYHAFIIIIVVYVIS